MTKNRDFKRVVRARVAKTGESYSAALAQLRRAGAVGAAADVVRGPGKNAETAALARVLAAVGVVAPHTNRPFTEEMLLGVGGGLGAAYFLFDYKTFTSLYVGGRINPYVTKTDFVEAAARRLGALGAVRTSSTPRAAEKQLRDALAAGNPVIATVELVLIPLYALPVEMAGATPHTVVVSQEDDGDPSVTDRAPAPFRMSWKALGEARARYRAAKNRIVVVEPARGAIDLEAAIRAGIADTVRGMTRPPMGNFGLAALTKWAELAGGSRDPKSWPKVFAGGRRLVQAMRWLYHWIETAGTGGGNFRAMYAGFLDEAAAVLDAPPLREAAARYRQLAADWRALAHAALPDDVPAFREARTLMDKKSRLVGERGAAASDEIAEIEARLRALSKEHAAQAPSECDSAALFADIAGRVRTIAHAEAEALRILAAFA